MDRKLVDLLACPATRQPLSLLEAAGIEALNRAIAAGGVRRVDGSPQREPLREALLTRDRDFSLFGELVVKNPFTLVSVSP